MLATLALGLTLAGGTTAAAAVATQPDQAAQRKAMYESELRQNLNLRDQRTREAQPATATTDLELSDAMRRSIARVPDPYVPPAVPAAPDGRRHLSRSPRPVSRRPGPTGRAVGVGSPPGVPDRPFRSAVGWACLFTVEDAGGEAAVSSSQPPSPC